MFQSMLEAMAASGASADVIAKTMQVSWYFPSSWRTKHQMKVDTCELQDTTCRQPWPSQVSALRNARRG